MYALFRKLRADERHIPKNEGLIQMVAPTITVETTKKRIKFVLPEWLNTSEYSFKFQSWALVGTDRNGNEQIIFGQNRIRDGEPFERTLYLYTKKKEVYPRTT